MNEDRNFSAKIKNILKQTNKITFFQPMFEAIANSLEAGN
jgi:hypothetical protein